MNFSQTIERIAFVLVLVLASVLMFNIGKCNGTVTNPTEIQTVAVPGPTVHDTLYKVALPPKNIASMGKAIVKVDSTQRVDSCAEIAPFVATYNDIQNCDTIYAEYEYPSNRFAVWIRSAPDSATVVSKTITLPYPVLVPQVQSEKRPWWIDALTHTGAFAVGFVLSQNIK